MWTDSFAAWLDRCASNSLVALAALAVLIGSTIALTILNPKENIRERLEQTYHSPQNAVYLSTDTIFLYDKEKLYRMLNAYGEPDYRDHYRFLKLDFIYPFLYGISLAFITAYLQRTLSHGDSISCLWVFPLAALLFDVAENASMWQVLNAAALASQAKTKFTYSRWVGFARAMTCFKLICIYTSLLLLITGGTGFFLKKVWRLKL
ncbi:MAG: hypothetical protein QOD28_752 [Acidobacteriota bacterium]|nr:hypothetical protein [Acidobacteriota bacterium]